MYHLPFILLGLIGTILLECYKRPRACNWFWLFSNIGLVVCNAMDSRWDYAGLFVIYLVLAVIGLRRWKDDGTDRSSVSHTHAETKT